jgi:hypothetical protein
MIAAGMPGLKSRPISEAGYARDGAKQIGDDKQKSGQTMGE